MLARLVLLAVQLIVAWFGAPYVVRYIPGLGGLQLFVYAAVFAVIVWIVGLVLSQVLRDTGLPSSATGLAGYRASFSSIRIWPATPSPTSSITPITSATYRRTIAPCRGFMPCWASMR